MKPIILIWTTILLIASIDIKSQTPCDSTMAGISINLSINQNCRLDIDTSLARMLLSNPKTELTYNAVVFNSEGDSILPNTLTQEHIGRTFKIAITGSGCPAGSAGATGAWTTLNLQDKIDPVITCSDTTLSCVDFFFYKDAGGIVQECDLDTVQTIFLDIEPACDMSIDPMDSISTIATRIFRATDNSGNSDTCSQQINVKRLRRSDILFPHDLMITCDTLSSVTDKDGNLIAPSLDLMTGSGTLMGQYIFGVPTGSGASFYGNNFKACRVRARYQDMPPVPYGCEVTYQRFWTVYEWSCNNEEVEHTSVQTITFKDTTPPEFSFSTDTLIVKLDVDKCDIILPIDSLGIVGLSDNCASDEDLEIKILSPITLGKGSDSTVYISGVDTTNVTILAKDPCGKSITKDLVVITEKSSRPSAICIGSMEIALNSSEHPVKLPVSSFNVGSYDPCGTVTLSARKMTVDTFSTDFIKFDCTDGKEAMVVLKATDEFGRTSLCMTTVSIEQDTFCVNASTVSLEGLNGYVRYIDEVPLAGITVKAENNPSLNTQTNKEGYYEMPGVSVGSTINILPIKDDKHELGITTLDVILLQRHMMGLVDLDSPYKIIAGDINANGSIDAVDLLDLRKMILGKIEKFPNNTSYVFVPESLEFIDPYDPWENGKVLGMTTTIENQMDQLNFMAFKVGDVNQSFLEAESRSQESVQFTYETVTIGNYIELNITSPQDLYLDGFQANLSFDPELLKLMKVGSNDIKLRADNYNLSDIEDGIIPLSWNDIITKEVKQGDVIFRATFEKVFDAPATFSFINNHRPSQAYLSDQITALTLDHDTKEFIVQDFAIYQNAPNPWASTTDIQFDIPTDGIVEINMYSAAMNKVFSDKQFYKAGKNTLTIDYDDLSDKGIFIYEIIYGDQVRVSKMTKL